MLFTKATFSALSKTFIDSVKYSLRLPLEAVVKSYSIFVYIPEKDKFTGDLPKFVWSTVPVAFIISLCFFKLSLLINISNSFFASSGFLFAESIFFANSTVISLGRVEFVDSTSFTFLKGSLIDYVDDGLNKGIKFINPNAKAVCGCGESFTL